MTYAEYVEQFLRFVWREHDVELEADMSFYIKMAEARLSRDLRSTQRMENASMAFQMTASEALLHLTVHRLSLVSDALTGRQVEVKTAAQLAAIRYNQSPGARLTHYALIGRTIRVNTNPTISEPLDLILDYHANVPSLEADNTSWVVDEYLDLYNAAVFVQACIGMKSDQRKALADSAYNSALASVLADDVSNKWGDNPLPTTVPYGAW